MVDWVQSDAGFVARLNRAKTYRAERIRADIQSLASDAVVALRKLISGPVVPPAVRLRASLAVLEAADAMKAETIVSTSAEGVQASMEHRALIESLGGATLGTGPFASYPTSALVARIPRKNQALRVFSVTIQISSINKPRCTN